MENLVDAADREVEVDIISNGPSPSRQPMYLLKRKFVERKFAEACRIRANMKFYIPSDPNEFVHMKALIADIDNPSKARAITGTDNMSNRYRTREILVEPLNYNNISGLHQYIRDNVTPGVRRVQF